jgi:hypothetical protein
MTGVRQSVAAGVAEHVGMDRKGKAGALADALDQTVDGVGSKRAAALGGEHEGLSGDCRRNSRSMLTSSRRIGSADGFPF